jgi:hypothetical protein
MNTAAKTFAIAIFAVCAAAATGVGLANRTAATTTAVVKLERVVVVGKRTDTAVIAQLPRVVIEGRRAVQSEATLASAQAAVPLV